MKIGRNHKFSDLSPRQGDLHGAFGVGISLRQTFAAVISQNKFNLNSTYSRPKRAIIGAQPWQTQ